MEKNRNNREKARTASVLTLLPYLVIGLLLHLAVPIASAQLTVGHVTGTVHDPTGSIVVGAQVTLINKGTGLVTTTRSTDTGTYVFEVVNPGTYTLRVDAPGFTPQETNGVEVHIQQTITQDYSLAVGNVNDNVTVTTSPPILQSEDASIGQTLSTKEINDLPLAGRDWTALAHLAAGTTTVANGGASGLTFSANGVNTTQNDIRLNGVDDNMEFYGASGTISIQATTSVVPPPDAIQEFKLQTGDMNASFGHSTGSVLNAVLKSGTDSFHGDLWEYLRNDAFNANDFFTKRTRSRPSYKQHQFGGTIGGPVRLPFTSKGVSKTFFFFDAQRILLATPRFVNGTVPTPGMQNSNFTDMRDLVTKNTGTRTDTLGRTFSTGTVLDPSTTRATTAGAVDPITGLIATGTGFARDPFFTGGSLIGITNFTNRSAQLNQISASRFDPNAVRLLKLYPAATNANVLINNFLYTPGINLELNQYDIRIDHNINDRNLLWGVYSWYHAAQTTAGSLPGIALGSNYGAGFNDSPHWATALSYTHIFTPTLTNSVHFGMQSTTDNNLPPNGNTPGIPEQYGIRGIPFGPGLGGLPRIGLSNFLTLGAASYNPITRVVRSIEIQDDLNKVYRNHNFQMGYELTRITAAMRQPTNGVGNVVYNGQYTDVVGQTGFTSVADMLITPSASTVGGPNNIGGVQQFVKSNAPTIHNVRYYNAAYFQDDWKVTPRFTANLGVRWDYYLAPIETDDRQANMIAGGVGNGPGGTYYVPRSTCGQVPATFVAQLKSNNIDLACTDSRNLGSAQKMNFAPRIGFAYRVSNGFVIRGGYGIAYGALANVGAAPYVLGNNFPFAFSTTQTAGGPANPLTLSNGDLPVIENVFASIDLSSPDRVNPAFANANLAGRVWNYQTPYTQAYNLTIQKQVTSHDSVQAAYVGTIGRHLDARSTYNVPSVIVSPSANLTNYLPFPSFAAGSAFLTTNAKSSYNSLQTVYNHQFNRGVSLMANYTYAKCMTTQASITDGLTYRAQWVPGLDLDKEYTLCPNDATHAIHASTTYEIPFGRGRAFMSNAPSVAQALLGGWAVNGIYHFQSGQPFTVPCRVRTALYFNCNAIKTGVSPYAGYKRVDQWLNPAAFTTPAIATNLTGSASIATLGGLSQQVRGPAFYNIDASVFKEFPVHEQVRLQFRAEAYNVLNHGQFRNPSANLDYGNTTAFAQITATRNDNRLMQFALKLYY